VFDTTWDINVIIGNLPLARPGGEKGGFFNGAFPAIPRCGLDCREPVREENGESA